MVSGRLPNPSERGPPPEGIGVDDGGIGVAGNCGGNSAGAGAAGGEDSFGEAGTAGIPRAMTLRVHRGLSGRPLSSCDFVFWALTFTSPRVLRPSTAR